MDNQPPTPQPPLMPQPGDQPQPVVPPAQPVQPTPPVPPQPPQFGAQPPVMSQPSYSMPPSSGKKKPLIIVAIIAGVLLILGALFVAYALLFYVSKDDYIEASAQYESLTTEANTLGTKLSSIQYSVGSGTDTVFKNDLAAAKEAISKVREENQEFSELKAVKIGEGKEKYQVFDAKLQAFLTFIDDSLTSFSDMRGAAVICDDTTYSSSDADALKTAINKCVAALKEVNDTPNADVKEYVTRLQAEYEKLSSVVTQAATITDPYGAQYSQYTSLRDQMYDIQDTLADIPSDFTSNYEKHLKEVDVTEAREDLVDFLQSKSK